MSVKAQHTSEEHYRLLVEGVLDYAIYMLDPDGRILSWNAGAERIKGYTRSEILGRSFSQFYPQEDQRSGKPRRELALALEHGRVQDEGWRVRKDGRRFWANVTITALFDEAGRHVGFAKVTRDETRRRHIEDLEEASRRMEEFLALLAHELRNPLAPIRNAAAIMRLRPIDDPGLAWSRDVIDRQARHMTRLVDDLLDVSRVTTGMITLAREPCRLADVLDQAIETTQPLLEGRRQELVVKQPETPLVVEGDPLRLTQIVIGLLNNAARFSPEGAPIRLSTFREGRDAVIKVADEGIGISQELLPRVFDLFLQGDETRGRTEGGLGIGLTLVRGLAEMHGGSVEARSPGPGRGSTFYVRLPLLLHGRDATTPAAT